MHYWKSGRKTYINQQCHLHNATWGKHRHFYDCIFMIFTLQLENYNCKINNLARSNFLLHLIQIWSGIRITKQIATKLASIFFNHVQAISFSTAVLKWFVTFFYRLYVSWSKTSLIQFVIFFLSKQLTTKKVFFCS